MDQGRELNSISDKTKSIPNIAQQETARSEKLQGNGAAQREKSAFEDDYEDQTEAQLLAAQKGRDEKTRNTFHGIFITGLKIAGISLILLFIARFWHLLAPIDEISLFGLCGYISPNSEGSCITLRWLSPEQLQEIDRLLFSGTLGALLARYLAPIITNGNNGHK